MAILTLQAVHACITSMLLVLARVLSTRPSLLLLQLRYGCMHNKVDCLFALKRDLLHVLLLVFLLLFLQMSHCWVR